MKQTSFDTKRKAEELLRKAKDIWQQTEHSEYLEGLEDDPVFILLMNALAYQSNETDSEIEQIKTDVIEEFENLLSLDYTGSPVPACMAVKMTPLDTLNAKFVDSTSIFSVNSKNHSFHLIPLFDTLAINAQVDGIQRLDQRRWSVSFIISQTLHDLRGWSFSINGLSYHDLSISLEKKNGEIVPLQTIGPEEYSELPMSSAFSVETLLYNRIQGQAVGGGRHGALSSYMNWCAMDIFARENQRMYFVSMDDDNAVIQEEMDRFNIIFEFSGVAQDFVFNLDNLSINTNILVNAERHEVQLSSDSPIERMTGGRDRVSSCFLHLIRPDEEQIFGATPLQIRRVMSDRFNHTKLQKLIYNLIGKYHSDFYAFLSLGVKSTDGNIQRLRHVLADMQKDMESVDSPIDEGVYVMIDSAYLSHQNTPISLRVEYLTTNGDDVNEAMSDGEMGFCEGISSAERIGNIVPGVDSIRNSEAERMASKYIMMTGDRLVTPFDVKLFVQTELRMRYDIVREMISSVKVTRDHFDLGTFHTFKTVVTVLLIDNKFIRRNFINQIPVAEDLLMKLIEVRSSNTFPVEVKINIQKK